MTAFITRMPAGFVGQISRDPGAAVIETEQLDATSIPAAFGLFVKTVSGKLQQADTVASITGLLVRGYPSQSTTNTAGAAAPVASSMCNRARKAYATVLCAYGTPAKDGIVYMRVTASGGTRTGGAVGDLEATADGAYNAAVTGARWTGGVDSAGVAEIAYNM